MGEDETNLGDVEGDRLPAPVCRFAFEEGAAVVRAANRRFEEAIPLAPGDRVGTVFDPPDGYDDVVDALRTDEQFVVRGSTTGGRRRFLLAVTPPTDAAEGYLELTDLSGVDGVDVRTDVDPASGEDAPDVSEGLAVDHVASVVSHDLRNPLDVARARLRAARDLDEDEHLDHVEQAHERMERIIQDVLTLARGEDVVDPDEPVDLGTVAERAWATVETNGAALTIEDALPTALADTDRVSRLFENLFRNSVEHGSTSPRSHAPEDSVEHGSTGHADASVDAGDRDGVHVTVGRLEGGFYVADDGPGIPPEDRARVFEPGYSVDEHGTGLGLAIVARIADLHGWQVDVTDAECGGARFEFRGVDRE